jgi:hypothetical protein
MEDNKKPHILLIEDKYEPVLTHSEAKALDMLQQDFVSSYIKNKDKYPVEEWLAQKIQSHLPGKTPEDARQISDQILTTIHANENKKKSLETYLNEGGSKESWIIAETEKAISSLTNQEAAKYLHSLDSSIANANKALQDTIRTQSGLINMNPQLDGFIAEQHHAQSFNLNAEATGSTFRAKALEPGLQGYTKNSVDLVITDADGKIVRRYQSKYCSSAEYTSEAFENGDYRGQRRLVPDGQEANVKNSSNVIEAPDGTTSNPLSKTSAKDLQRDAQSGNWKDWDWNEYKFKDLAIGIGKQAGQAALLGAAVGSGSYLAGKAWRGEKIEGSEVIEAALKSGVDSGIKAAVTGALKVAVEKDIIKVIPKGTSAGTLADIAFIAIENVKIAAKIATGELSLSEGYDKMEQTTISCIFAKESARFLGGMVGKFAGFYLGPVGAKIGGYIGSAIGHMAGSKFGECVAEGVKTIRKSIVSTVRSIANGVKNLIGSVMNFV